MTNMYNSWFSASSNPVKIVILTAVDWPHYKINILIYIEKGDFPGYGTIVARKGEEIGSDRDGLR